jgi:hypothetical protein
VLKRPFGSFIKDGTFWKEVQYSIVEGESLALLEAMTHMEH